MSILRSGRVRKATELHVTGLRVKSTTLNVMGMALTAVSAGMVIGGFVELGSTNRDTSALFWSALVTFVAGITLFGSTQPGEVRPRDVFASVGWTWVIVTGFGALPYVLGGTFDVSGIDTSGQIVNAIFESASGYSATGSTALTDFSIPGRGMLMYRQITQWYGGMGIVVLAVAVLPFLGVGGLDLLTAEAPGPGSDRLTPRVSQTAKGLWSTYVLFTVAVATALIIIPGPSVYDAIAHGFSTVATGGFSPHASSIGHFDSVAVEIAIIAGMLVSGINFNLHLLARSGTRNAYWANSEFRAYIAMLVGCALLIIGILWLDGGFAVGESIRVGIFNVVALATSTGFGNATNPGGAGDFALWMPAAQMILLFLFVVGASTSSTSGGIKVMRLQVLLAHSIRSIRRSQHPRAVIAVKHGAVAVREDVISRMAGFFVVYAILVLSGIILLTAVGGGPLESISAIIGALSNMGPALGEAGPTGNFTEAFTEPGRLVLSAYMLIGRLEFFPILLMFAAPIRAMRERIL